MLGLPQVHQVLFRPVAQHQCPAEHQQPLGQPRVALRGLHPAVAQHQDRAVDEGFTAGQRGPAQQRGAPLGDQVAVLGPVPRGEPARLGEPPGRRLQFAAPGRPRVCRATLIRPARIRMAARSSRSRVPPSARSTSRCACASRPPASRWASTSDSSAAIRDSGAASSRPRASSPEAKERGGLLGVDLFAFALPGGPGQPQQRPAVGQRQPAGARVGERPRVGERLQHADGLLQQPGVAAELPLVLQHLDAFQGDAEHLLGVEARAPRRRR